MSAWFIVIHKLTVGPITRDKLLNSSQLLAQKMARLHGINAPEFSDKRLFNLFVDGLIDQGLVQAGKDEKLTYDPLFDRVLRAAEYVIDPQNTPSGHRSESTGRRHRSVPLVL